MKSLSLLLVILLTSVCVEAQKRDTLNDLRDLTIDQKARAVFINDLVIKKPIYESSFEDEKLTFDSIKLIYITRSVFDTVDLSGKKNYPNFIVHISDNCKGDNLRINSFTLDLRINNSTIGELSLANCLFQPLNIQNLDCRKLSLSEAKVTKEMYISRNVFCDTIDLSGFGTNPTSDLSILSVSKKNLQSSTLIFDYSTRFDNMEIDLSKFDLRMDESCDDCKNSESYNTFFTAELAYFKTNGQDKNYETLYYFYRKWQVQNANIVEKLFNYYLPKEFYGFGLKKVLILRATLILFLLSIVIFLISYNTIRESYTFEFKDEANVANSTASGEEPTPPNANKKDRFYKAFILTAIVFFSFKLEYKYIDFTKKLGLIIFFLVFLTGLICYAFLANFIFTFK
jgi:hypothetical protein